MNLVWLRCYPSVDESSSGGGLTGDLGTGNGWLEGKLSAPGFRFIKGYEGFGEYAYQDSAGYWTIAYGVTLHGEKDIYNQLKAQEPVSEENGAKISYQLKNERYGAKIIDACKNLGVTKQYQFDALVSLAYNCGYGVVTGINNLTTAIKKNINDENAIRLVWENFYTTSGGTQLAGLVARRKQECNMFFGKPVENRPIVTIKANGSYGSYISSNNGDGWLPS